MTKKEQPIECKVNLLENRLDKLEDYARFLNKSKVAVTSAENHQRLIESLEKDNELHFKSYDSLKESISNLSNRVQALEDGIIQIDPLITDKNGNGIVTHKDGGYTVYPNIDISKAYSVPNPNIELNIITDWLEENGNPEIYAKVEADLVKKSDENLNKDEAKLSEVKEPDWEDLLSGDDLVEAYKDTNVLDSKIINRKIHDRIKPLLEENNSLHKEVISLEDKLELGNKVIAKLNSTFNDRLLDATRNAVEALQETQLELNEANERISQLEALNTTYELSILNRTELNEALNNIDNIDFWYNNYKKIYFKNKFTSQYRGVTKKKNGKYQASIKIDNKMVHLGVFDNEQEASEAYIIAFKNKSKKKDQ